MISSEVIFIQGHQRDTRYTKASLSTLTENFSASVLPVNTSLNSDQGQIVTKYFIKN